MHHPRRAFAAAVSISMALGAGVAVAHADTSSILYVNNNSASCTDDGSGAGSAATPFCSIQAASDAATPGTVVDIYSGMYSDALDITSGGTAGAPITFQPVGNGVIEIGDGDGQSGPALTLNASYVDFSGDLSLTGYRAPGIFIASVLVDGASHITLDGINPAASEANYAIHVTGTSSDVSITHDTINGVNSGVLVDAGSSGDVISTNVIGTRTSGIEVDGTSDAAITSNTVYGQAAAAFGIKVGPGATGTSVEDNIVAAPITSTPTAVSSGAAVIVDSAAAGTTEDYNVVWPNYGGGSTPVESAYAWAGTDYASQSAFTAATGQGAHDLVANPQMDRVPFASVVSAPQFNSANSAAPGWLAEDVYGTPCSSEPEIAVTGAGPQNDCQRGAVQQSFTTTLTSAAYAKSALTVNLNSVMSASYKEESAVVNVNPVPTPAISYLVDWGDGSTPTTTQGSASNKVTTSTHTYARPGTYTITDTAELPTGGTAVSSTSYTTTGSAYTAFGPKRMLDTRKGIGAAQAKVAAGKSVTLDLAGVDGLPADITAVALNLTVVDATGNGYLTATSTGSGVTTSNLNYLAGETVANSVIVPVNDGSITIYNSGAGSADVIADVSGYFTQTTADGYATTTLQRILDTRHGTGAPTAKVAGNSGIAVTIAGADAIPSGVDAVAVHVTVVDTAGNGWIAAEPDGAGVPTTSILNYLKGQTVSDTVIVPVAADGKIELYNGGGTGSVDLIADVSGYFSAGAPDAYMPITPTRVWDTRQITGWTIPAGLTEAAWLEGDNGDATTSMFPASATLVANITATNTKGNGYLTVYPWGTSRPTSSNLNFTTNQTVAGLALLGTTGADQEVAVYNGSPTGSTDVIFDVFGYFTNS